MPRRGGGAGQGGASGGGGGGRRWNNDGGGRMHNYNEHDDRREKNQRRVSFKQNSNKNKNRMFGSALKRLEEDDIDMKDQAVVGNISRNNQFYRGGFRGRGRKDGRVNSPAPRQPFIPKKLIQGSSPWYQVTIPYGNKHEKSFILKALLTALAPDIFIPHCYNIVGNTAIFYVDEFSIAEKLNQTDRKITLPDGFKLGVKVKSGIPHVTIEGSVIEKMKLAMANRYNAATKALDLTKFHSDPSLIDVFCALFRPSILIAAVDIIAENIPDLEALNLNNNKIHSIENFKGISKKLPNLKILYLANNRIPHINSLEALKGFPLMELFLEGNPLADRFKEKDIYIREVRKRFPKIAKLDGADLPPVIGFDVSDDINLPPSKPSFLCNVEGQGVVKQFLEQYFALYDSESRQPLLDAYHENAMFSLSASYGSSLNNHNNFNNKLNSYTMHSRNLLRTQDRDVRNRHLKIGRLQVVSFLNDLPKTQHDPLSFTVDLTVFTPTMLMLTINGVFKETTIPTSSTSNRQWLPPIRSFHKTLVIVPFGGGFCIKNDILYVTNATPEQEAKCFKTPVSTPTPVPVQTAQIPAMTAPPVSANYAPNADPRQQMLQTLATYSNMNLEWCTNCLEQTQWNIEKAVIIFDQLHSQGKIPPEAFIK
ncbi:nuclear RNA export factor small bristles isoform X2 [Arctopsyche grandis]|uniref:nuclear RNA export factor small bristles isoform X2 n=1 Tax=Arctopsyche grandis TaxID=121162 RepID=UPI00406D7253